MAEQDYNDPNRTNPDVHYRLYRSKPGCVVVVCVQDFDYIDYDVDPRNGAVRVVKA